MPLFLAEAGCSHGGATESEGESQDTPIHAVSVLLQAVSQPSQTCDFSSMTTSAVKPCRRASGQGGHRPPTFTGEGTQASEKLLNLSKDVPTNGKVRTEEAGIYSRPACLQVGCCPHRLPCLPEARPAPPASAGRLSDRSRPPSPKLRSVMECVPSFWADQGNCSPACFVASKDRPGWQ